MSKYLCLCGNTFKRKKHADQHTALFKDSDELIRNYHIIGKKLWRARVLDIVFHYPWARFFRGSGFFMILIVLENHFQINLSMWESIVIGIGIGLYVD